MTTHFSNQRTPTVCDTSFWSIKFIKTMKNQGVDKHYPLPKPTWKTGVWGMGDMPQGDSQSLKFHPAGEKGQPGHGGASSGCPDNSRASSRLAGFWRGFPEGGGGSSFGSRHPGGNMTRSQGAWQVIHCLLWFYYSISSLAGKLTANMFTIDISRFLSHP